MKEGTHNNTTYTSQNINVPLNTELFLNTQCYTTVEQLSFLNGLTAVNGIDRLISHTNFKNICLEDWRVWRLCRFLAIMVNHLPEINNINSRISN